MATTYDCRCHNDVFTKSAMLKMLRSTGAMEAIYENVEGRNQEWERTCRRGGEKGGIKPLLQPKQFQNSVSMGSSDPLRLAHSSVFAYLSNVWMQLNPPQDAISSPQWPDRSFTWLQLLPRTFQPVSKADSLHAVLLCFHWKCSSLILNGFEELHLWLPHLK